jgi:acetylornithine deacetylase/succinyl-diaminopimelate desuccinylase-like protein
MSWQAVQEYLHQHQPRLRKQFHELLRFASLADVAAPDGCAPCAEWIAQRCRALGGSAEVLPSDGQPCVIADFPGPTPEAPTLLAYAHYDVQPAEPLELWASPPFEPTERDGRLFARGAADDKCSVWFYLTALEAWSNTAGLPLHVKLIIEGEEEVGSPHMEAFIAEHKDKLAADALLICDDLWADKDHPSIRTALRGLCYYEVTFAGPNADLHSGIAGGVVRNPVNALAGLIAKLHDKDGRVTIPGFYDDVEDASAQEQAAWTVLNFDERAHAEQLGLDALAGGERGYTALQRNWARPTLDCNGIVGGHIGPGSKTVLPAQAIVKLSMRLVSHQNPETITTAFRQFVADNTPAGIRSEVRVFAAARPVKLGLTPPGAAALGKAVDEVFHLPLIPIRCGASIPITEIFQRVLGLNGVVTGFGLPDANVHSPNENIPLEQLHNGARAMTLFFQAVADELTGRQ